MILVGYYIEYLCRYFRKASNLLRNNEKNFFWIFKKWRYCGFTSEIQISGKLPREIYESYLKEIDSKIDHLIPEKLHSSLNDFFSQNLTEPEWQVKIDDLTPPEKNDDLMVATVRIIRRTLPVLYVENFIVLAWKRHFGTLQKSIMSLAKFHQNIIRSAT